MLAYLVHPAAEARYNAKTCINFQEHNSRHPDTANKQDCRNQNDDEPQECPCYHFTTPQILAKRSVPIAAPQKQRIETMCSFRGAPKQRKMPVVNKMATTNR